MKKILIIFYIFIFLCISENIAYAETVKIDGIGGSIGSQAINDPLSLPVWYPYVISPYVPAKKHLNLTPLIIPAVAGAGTLLKAKSAIKNPSNVPQKVITSDTFGSEEILYNIEFKNSEKTPVYSDTIIYIKIPEWLKYSENSLKLNNQKLTDADDKDRLTYSEEDGTLKISLKKLNPKAKTIVTFGAKALTSNTLKNNPYVLIKFQSKSKNTEMDWLPFSGAQ